MTDPLSNRTTNTYDTQGNLLSVTTPVPNGNTAASVTQFQYDTKGELTQITDPLNHVTKLTYTSAGLMASITDAQNNVTTYQYDQRGNRTAVIDPINGSSHPTTFVYDIMNRLTGITYPDGSTVGFRYDLRGRRITATDQNGKTTTYTYDDADRLTAVTDPANNTTQYAYDTEGNLLSITDANSHMTQFAYNVREWVTQTTFPSNVQESYTYDLVGNLLSKTDRKNQTIQHVYDALYRLTSKTYPDSTSVEYAYDLAGKVQQVSDPTGTYSFAYDNMGRLIGTTTQYAWLPALNLQNSYTYDAASNRTSLTAPEGRRTKSHECLSASMPIPRWVARFNLHVTNRILGPLARWAPGMAVVIHVGRKTQRQYYTPVMVFRCDNRFVIALTYGRDSHWVQNVLAANGCELETRKRRVPLSHPRLFHDARRRDMPVFVRFVLGIINVADFLELAVDQGTHEHEY